MLADEFHHGSIKFFVKSWTMRGNSLVWRSQASLALLADCRRGRCTAQFRCSDRL